MIDLPSSDATSYAARIYSNTVAKYWSDDFLELDEMINDESNTSKAFKAIESTLNRNIRNIAPRDHTIIRNAVISYFKSHEHFDRQFRPVPSVINARIKKIYEVNDGIQIRITDEVHQLEETISAYQDADGIRFIRIKTNNELTYRQFCGRIPIEN